MKLTGRSRKDDRPANQDLWRKKAMKKAITILITVIRLVRMGDINRKRMY